MPSVLTLNFEMDDILNTMNPQISSQIKQALQFFENGNLSSAEDLLKKILQGQPRNLDALHILGGIYAQQNKLDDAVKQLRKALKIYPNHPGANYYLALVFSMKNEPKKAIPYHQKSIKLDPSNYLCHLNYGVSLAQLKEFDLASVSFNKAITLNQSSAEAWSNLGSSLKEINKLNDSLHAFERALSINPNYAQVWSNKGNALNALRRYDEALASYDKALSIDPSYAEAWSNKGSTLNVLKRYDEALASYENVLRINPNYLDTHYNESHIRLVLGEFPIGWEKYEYRWKRNDHEIYRHPRIPRLTDLKNITNKKILIWAEQGLGDTIQFSRYIPMLTSLGAQVIFEVQTPLKSLLSSIPDCKVIGRDEPFPQVDFQCPLLSLPLIFKTALESIPSPNSYLRAQPEKVSQWGKKINLSHERVNVGISCSGNEAHRNDTNRSMRLELFSPLSELANLFLIQKDIRDTDRDFLQQHPEIRFVGDQLLDFDDTAALVESMDLIISVDTSLVHLAGSLEKPVLVLLPWAPDWRWLLDINNSPWYPAARLFRQPDIGNWSSVIHDVLEEVKSFQKAVI